jgi:alpha-L-fucosidase
MNVGPLGDGRLPEAAQQALLEVGRRLRRDGWPEAASAPGFAEASGSSPP